MSKRKDLTNQRFGKLLVVEMLYNYNNKGLTYCHCKCNCGNYKNVLSSNLVSGKTKSCGCYERESRYGRQHLLDLTGQRFGSLVVKRITDERTKNGQVYWECQCDCGNYRKVSSGSLRRGAVTSCGCKNFQNIKLDLTGKTFGLLTPMYSTHSQNRKVNRTAWVCKCGCGKEIIATTDDLINGNTISCGCSVMSGTEIKIDNLLKSFNVTYKYNYRFDDCVNPKTGRKLPFDFYILPYNIIIEYDGLQHFQPIAYWGGKQAYEHRVELDLIKNEYCKSHHIKLVRIPYYYNDNQIKDLLIDILNPVTITAV